MIMPVSLKEASTADALQNDPALSPIALAAEACLFAPAGAAALPADSWTGALNGNAEPDQGQADRLAAALYVPRDASRFAVRQDLAISKQ